MTVDVHRFEFDPSVPLADAEMSLQLAAIALEGLFGQATVRLDTSYYVDEPRRVIIVNGTTVTGEALVRIFTGFLIREFGEDAFQVRRTDVNPDCASPAGRAA